MRRTNFKIGLPPYTFMRMGEGLHTGETTKIMVTEGHIGTGINFERGDVAGRPKIPAHFKNIRNSERATTLGLGAGSVRTVEHLMAALVISGLWNARIACFGPEVPLLDGSVKEWVEAMKEADLYRRGGAAPWVYRLKDTTEFEGTHWSCRIEPAAEPSLDLRVDFPNPGVGTQKISLGLTQAEMEKELAEARTFGFRSELEDLISNQLIKGADYQRAVLFEDDGSVATPDGLRFKDEPVRHKAVDLIGDFALLGAPLMAKITARGTGHGAHREIMWGLYERDLLVRETSPS